MCLQSLVGIELVASPPWLIQRLAQSPYSGVETGGAGGGPGGGGRGGTGPPLFCNAVSNENNMKNIEITNGLIFKKHVAFLTSRLPMILCL